MGLGPHYRGAPRPPLVPLTLVSSKMTKLRSPQCRAPGAHRVPAPGSHFELRTGPIRFNCRPMPHSACGVYDRSDQACPPCKTPRATPRWKHRCPCERAYTQEPRRCTPRTPSRKLSRRTRHWPQPRPNDRPENCPTGIALTAAWTIRPIPIRASRNAPHPQDTRQRED